MPHGSLNWPSPSPTQPSRAVQLARAAPLAQERAIGVEYLDAVVAGIRDVDVTLVIHRHGAREVELARRSPRHADLADLLHGLDDPLAALVGIPDRGRAVPGRGGRGAPQSHTCAATSLRTNMLKRWTGSHCAVRRRVLPVEHDIPELPALHRVADAIPHALPRQILVRLPRPPDQAVVELVVAVAQVRLHLADVLVADDHHRRVHGVTAGAGAVVDLVRVVPQVPLQRPGRIVVIGHLQRMVAGRLARDLLDLPHRQLDVGRAVGVHHRLRGVVVVDEVEAIGHADRQDDQNRRQAAPSPLAGSAASPARRSDHR